MGIDANAAPIIKQAVRDALGREGTAAERQYVQSVARYESAYGNGWDDRKNGGPGACIGSNNWGSVQCSTTSPAPGCCPHVDSQPSGKQYMGYYKIYSTPLAGATDVARHVLIVRPRTRAALEERRPTVFRASFAMRREHYYGGFCTQATNRYGAAVADDSFPHPDASAGTRACEKEAVTAHAKKVWSVLQGIAQDTGEPVALELGTFDDAYSWWHGGGGAGWKGALAGLLVSAACGGAAWWLVKKKRAA